jgi:hypothetical protein
MMKLCIACGMPMEKPSDYAMGDEKKDYCVHCCRPDGMMQSYEEKREGLTNFIIKTQGFDQRAAEQMAVAMMRKLPAWQNNHSCKGEIGGTVQPKTGG